MAMNSSRSGSLTAVANFAARPSFTVSILEVNHNRAHLVYGDSVAAGNQCPNI